MQISVKSNIREVTGRLHFINKKAIKTATRNTLNDLAKQVTRQNVPGGLRQETSNTFVKKSGAKGATNHTRTGFFYTRANKQNLTAFVFWDQKRGDYMNTQTYGGTRKPNSRYIVVPHKKNGGKLTDPHGNIQWAKYGAMKRDKTKFFEGKPTGFPNAKLGLWERYPTSGGKRSQKIRQIAAFKEQTTHRPLFDFEPTVRSYVKDRQRGFNPQFTRNLRLSMRRYR
mgnify:FL=1